MLLGPEIIRQCKYCKGLFRQLSVLSGSSALAKSWSDGKVRSAMCPDVSYLVKCPNCTKPLWVEESIIVQEVAIDSNDALEALPPLAMALQDYVELLGGENLEYDHEYYLRTLLWWESNNSRRYGNSPQLEYSKLEINNLLKLEQLTFLNTDAERLARAEINRELGRFSDAEKLLQAPFSACFETRVALLLKLIQKEYPFVVRWPDESQFGAPLLSGIQGCDFPELYKLLIYVEGENDGIIQISELNCRRILNDRELIIESYHNLKSWTNNRSGSDSENLQMLILGQFEESCPWLKATSSAADVDFGWLIQEYICSETGDYSFGVNDGSHYTASDEPSEQGEDFIKILLDLANPQSRDH